MWSERNNKVRKAWRQKTRNKSDINYYHTFKGIIVRKYVGIKARIKGQNYMKGHLYYGIKLCSKEAFYKWAMSSKELKIIYKNWANSGFERTLSPCAMRINRNKGYVISNMCWTTQVECCRIAGARTHARRKMRRTTL